MPLSDPVQAVCLTINLLDGTVLNFLRVLASKEARRKYPRKGSEKQNSGPHSTT